VHDFLESLPEFGIKYCIDDGIHEAIHVPMHGRDRWDVKGVYIYANIEDFMMIGIKCVYELKAHNLPKPRCKDECGHARLAGIIQLSAHRIHNIAGEKRNPTYEKNACIKR
jgi:hypothetical protein